MSISRSRLHLPNAGSTRPGKGLCLCANCNWLLQPDPTSHQLTQVHLQWASHATCAGGVFLVPTSAFDVCAYNLSTCIKHNLIDNVKLSVAKRAINTPVFR